MSAPHPGGGLVLRTAYCLWQGASTAMQPLAALLVGRCSMHCFGAVVALSSELPCNPCPGPTACQRVVCYEHAAVSPARLAKGLLP